MGAAGCAATTNSCGPEPCASSPKQHEKQTLLTSPTSRRGSPSPTCRRLSESDALNRRITFSGPETLQAGPSMAEDCLIPQPVTPHTQVRRNLLRKGNKRSDEIFRKRNNRREEIL